MQYTEKELFADALTAEKTATGLYNIFANECTHKNIRDEVMCLLNEEHGLQEEVFNMMHEKGYYPTPEAEMKKVEETKSKYAQSIK